MQIQSRERRAISDRRIPRAFTTRRVPRDQMVQLVAGDRAPRPGDLVLVRIDELGQHTRIQLPSTRRRNLFLGDEVILCYGNRYAPRQFEAIVPGSLEPCHLVAAGGVAARALSWHEKVYAGPTCVTPIGLVADAAGQPLNVADWALSAVGDLDPEGPAVIAFAGTAMNAGKTTAAAFLAHGLVRSGLRVGYAKLTGTGAGGDPGLLHDAGASPVLDFTDAGHASTYLVPQTEIERIAVVLLSRLQAQRVDVILVELADGLFQEETERLLRSKFFRRLADAMIFCAGDAMGAAHGCEWLRRHRHPMLALAGVLTAAPLQMREAMAATGVPVLSRAELADPATARKLAGEARACRRSR